MKISIDDQIVIKLSEIQKKVIQNDIPSEIFEEDMHRRLQYILFHPCERYVENNRDFFLKKLIEKKVKKMPSDKLKLAELVLEEEELEKSEDFCSKIFADKEEIFSISPTQKKILKKLCGSTPLDSYIKEQLSYILTHKYEKCMERLRDEWEVKLAQKGLEFFPVDDDAFATLVFSQPDYKNRSQRDKK